MPFELNTRFPAGEIVIYPYALTPIQQSAGQMLPCDGRALSRASYADLFAALGETFGSGDGSTTFELPNYQTNDHNGNPKSPTDSYYVKVY